MTSLPASVMETRTSRVELFSVEMGFRLLLAGAAVALCYLWNWPGLRYLTSELNIRIDALLGISLQRVSSDSVFWKGVVYHYVNACTFIDVWCGSIPLLWSLRRTISQNFATVVSSAFALFTFNVLRLSFSDVLFDHGLPWNVAHNVVSRFSYFAVWVALTEYRERSDRINSVAT